MNIKILIELNFISDCLVTILGRRILGFQLGAKAHSALVCSVLPDLRHEGLYLCYCDPLMYVMGVPSKLRANLGCLHLCYLFVTKGHGRPWLRPWAKYGVLGFWFLAISGAGKVSLTTVCQWGGGGQAC